MMENNVTRFMAMIDDKTERTAREEEQRANELMRKRGELFNAVTELKPRIADLITLGNYALEHGISIAEERIGYSGTYQDGDFSANRTRHTLGFIYDLPQWNPDRKVMYLGNYYDGNGGWCDRWHFMTNGNRVFDISYEDHESIRIPTIAHLERFLEQFPTFESEFYKHIEKMCK